MDLGIDIDFGFNLDVGSLSVDAIGVGAWWFGAVRHLRNVPIGTLRRGEFPGGSSVGRILAAYGKDRDLARRAPIG